MSEASPFHPGGEAFLAFVMAGLLFVAVGATAPM